MKFKVTMEVEFSELSDMARSELADGLNFRADEDESVAPDLEPVPKLSDYDDGTVMMALRDLLQDGLSSDDLMEEMWAGCDFYGRISEVEVSTIERVA